MYTALVDFGAIIMQLQFPTRQDPSLGQHDPVHLHAMSIRGHPTNLSLHKMS